MSMRILFMSAEIFPYAKTGGLGDVAAALTAALRGRGADVRLLLPGFPKIMENLSGIRDIAVLPAWDASARLLRGKLPGGFDTYVVDCPAYYARTGFYVDGEGLDWPDNHRRFGLLCRAGAWLERYDPDWRPDVIHCNDWHCGLTPAYVAGKPAPRP